MGYIGLSEVITSLVNSILVINSGWMIGCVLELLSETVYNRGRSLMFSNDRLFSINLTFPNLSQYPHIFRIFY